MAKKKKKAKARRKRAAKKPAAATTPPPAQYAPRAPVIDRARARRAYLMHRDHLRQLPGVETLRVGSRVRGGEATEELAIRLHMASQPAKERLKADAIAGKIDLQPYYEEVPIDLVVWKFAVSTNGVISDGSGIISANGTGTIGTIVRLGDRKWLTAAHVVSGDPSSSLPTTTSVEDLFGNLIGTVPAGSDHFVKNQFTDAAIIIPEGTPAPLPSGRYVDDVDKNDEGMPVSMHGASSGPRQGKIDSVLDEGFPLSDGTLALDHFLVRGIGGSFATGGDSGAVVRNGQRLLGIVRAVPPGANIALVSKLSQAQSYFLFDV